MKENDGLSKLFRNRLSGAEMNVRDGFWDELQSNLSVINATENAYVEAATIDSADIFTILSSQEDVSSSTPSNIDSTADGDSSPKKRKELVLLPRLYRIAAAASVALVLGVAAASFWYFSPKDEIQEAFTKVATLTPGGNLKGDLVQDLFPSIHEANPVANNSGNKLPANSQSVIAVDEGDEEIESVSVTVSFTVTQRVYNNQFDNSRYGNTYLNSDRTRYHNANNNATSVSDNSAGSSTQSSQMAAANRTEALNNNHKWAFKAGVGTSLPKNNLGMPFTANFSVERSLTKKLSLEAGLQYNYLDGECAIHTLAVPLKMNVLLTSSSKVDLYATLGGAAEKCIAGAQDNSFDAEPIQLSATAGLGVRYKLNDRIALFAEPSVSHHFNTDSQTKTLRTERPTNFNVLCGVRMTY